MLLCRSDWPWTYNSPAASTYLNTTITRSLPWPAYKDKKKKEAEWKKSSWVFWSVHSNTFFSAYPKEELGHTCCFSQIRRVIHRLALEHVWQICDITFYLSIDISRIVSRMPQLSNLFLLEAIPRMDRGDARSPFPNTLFTEILFSIKYLGGFLLLSSYQPNCPQPWDNPQGAGLPKLRQRSEDFDCPRLLPTIC